MTTGALVEVDVTFAGVGWVREIGAGFPDPSCQAVLPDRGPWMSPNGNQVRSLKDVLSIRLRCLAMVLGSDGRRVVGWESLPGPFRNLHGRVAQYKTAFLKCCWTGDPERVCRSPPFLTRGSRLTISTMRPFHLAVGCAVFARGAVSQFLVDPPTTADPNTIQDCTLWHIAASGDTCPSVSSASFITPEQLIAYVSRICKVPIS
jgi:hypothetical protein